MASLILPKAYQPKPSGKVPWSVAIKRGTKLAVVLDKDGAEIIGPCSPEIAGRIVGAVNMVECARVHREEQ